MTKVAVVTGGASGIGRAVVERFAKEDFSFVILDIDGEGGKSVAAEIEQRGKQAAFTRVDATDESDVRSTFDEIRKTHNRIPGRRCDSSLDGTNDPRQRRKNHDLGCLAHEEF